MWTGLAVAAVVAVAAGGVASAQDDGYYASGGGYAGGGGNGQYGGGGGGTGKVKLRLTAKKKQKSTKALKAKATCENRACVVNAKGKLRFEKKKAKLKRDQESLMAGEADTLKLKLPKKAKKLANRAAREDEQLRAKISATARGVGGGGEDSATVKVKLKP